MSHDPHEDPECMHCRHEQSFHPRGPCGAVVADRRRGTACCPCRQFIAPKAAPSEGEELRK